TEEAQVRTGQLPFRGRRRHGILSRPMMRLSPTAAARYLALIVALSLCSGCAQTVPLTTTSSEATDLVGRWTGSWRSGAASSRFTLQIARGRGDRLTATAVWSGLPTARRGV